jgi:hypothetical protein
MGNAHSPPLFAISLFLHCIIPSSKTIAMMVVIQKIAESRVIQQYLPELYESAISALKESLKPKN